jgi:transcriptional regulator with XRE-family HTH domain
MKKKNRKTKTFVFYGLGFPITLINTPMKKIFDEWVVDVDLTRLQLVIFRALAFKHGRLSKEELSFIRAFLRMTATEFGRHFGVSHAAVIQWEKGKRVLTPSTEFCIRLHMLGHLRAKASEFRDLYQDIPLQVLAKKGTTKAAHIKVDIAEDFKVA